MTKSQHRILVVEGNIAATCQLMRDLGGRAYGPAYAKLLEDLAPGIACSVVTPCESGPECLPDGDSISGFAGVAWTGSALNIYDNTKPILNQLRLAEKVLGAGLPVFGSCWGLQVFVTALGGKIRKNPRGREIGIAEDITLTEEGKAHPMYAGKGPVFDALAVHLDETEDLPKDAVVLARNAMSGVQALSIEAGGVDFWGVQYHPEFDFATLALAYKRLVKPLVNEGRYTDELGVQKTIAILDRLDREPGLESTGDLRMSPAVRDPMLRHREIANWLERVLTARDHSS